MHTLKGDAAACGYRELSELAHEFEDVLALKTNAAVIPEVALRASDVFGALIHAYHAGKKLPDLKPLRDEIARLANPERENTPKDAAEIETESKQKTRKSKDTGPWSEYERLAISHAAEDGKRLHHVIVQVDPQCGMPIAARQMIHIALASLGEVLAIYPPDEAGANGSTKIDRIQAALASEKSVDEIRVKCSIPTISQNVEVSPLRVQAPTNRVSKKSASAIVSELTQPDHATNADPHGRSGTRRARIPRIRCRGLCRQHSARRCRAHRQRPQSRRRAHSRQIHASADAGRIRAAFSERQLCVESSAMSWPFSRAS